MPHPSRSPAASCDPHPPAPCPAAAPPAPDAHPLRCAPGARGGAAVAWASRMRPPRRRARVGELPLHPHCAGMRVSLITCEGRHSRSLICQARLLPLSALAAPCIRRTSTLPALHALPRRTPLPAVRVVLEPALEPARAPPQPLHGDHFTPTRTRHLAHASCARCCPLSHCTSHTRRPRAERCTAGQLRARVEQQRGARGARGARGVASRAPQAAGGACSASPRSALPTAASCRPRVPRQPPTRPLPPRRRATLRPWIPAAARHRAARNTPARGRCGHTARAPQYGAKPRARSRPLTLPEPPSPACSTAAPPPAGAPPAPTPPAAHAHTLQSSPPVNCARRRAPRHAAPRAPRPAWLAKVVTSVPASASHNTPRTTSECACAW